MPAFDPSVAVWRVRPRDGRKPPVVKGIDADSDRKCAVRCWGRSQLLDGSIEIVPGWGVNEIDIGVRRRPLACRVAIRARRCATPRGGEPGTPSTRPRT